MCDCHLLPGPTGPNGGDCPCQLGPRSPFGESTEVTALRWRIYQLEQTLDAMSKVVAGEVALQPPSPIVINADPELLKPMLEALTKRKSEIDIHDVVLIKLTDRGRQYLKETHYDRARHPTRLVHIKPFEYPEEDADGWSEWRLRDLMCRFGSWMERSAPVGFLFDKTIRIKDKKNVDNCCGGHGDLGRGAGSQAQTDR